MSDFRLVKFMVQTKTAEHTNTKKIVLINRWSHVEPRRRNAYANPRRGDSLTLVFRVSSPYRTLHDQIFFPAGVGPFTRETNMYSL